MKLVAKCHQNRVWFKRKRLKCLRTDWLTHSPLDTAQSHKLLPCAKFIFFSIVPFRRYTGPKFFFFFLSFFFSNLAPVPRDPWCHNYQLNIPRKKLPATVKIVSTITHNSCWENEFKSEKSLKISSRIRKIMIKKKETEEKQWVTQPCRLGVLL